MQCLVEELGADANKTHADGWSPLFSASCTERLEVVQCLVKLGADINPVAKDGTTPLMLAAAMVHHKIVRYLLKDGADPQALHESLGTAADISKSFSAPSEQTAYLQARTHCANSRCTNASAGLKKCERCLPCKSTSVAWECVHSNALAGAQGGVYGGCCQAEGRQGDTIIVVLFIFTIIMIVILVLLTTVIHSDNIGKARATRSTFI
jgi:hypothetical protein